MKFLADQDVYAITIAFLSGLGHDSLTQFNSVWRTRRMPSCSVSPVSRGGFS
jgi:hypothetical protein